MLIAPGPGGAPIRTERIRWPPTAMPRRFSSGLLATVGVAAEMLSAADSLALGWVRRSIPCWHGWLFWWFGHPLRVLLLLPAYFARIWPCWPPAAWRKTVQRATRQVVFAMFVLLSTPVGFHHQFMNPECRRREAVSIRSIPCGSVSELRHGPSTIIASSRSPGGEGRTGMFGWIPRLPCGIRWSAADPLDAAVALGAGAARSTPPSA